MNWDRATLKGMAKKALMGSYWKSVTREFSIS